MTTTEQLDKKIQELNTEINKLNQQHEIDPLKSSAADISKNAQEKLQARESAAHLKRVVADLESQLNKQQSIEEKTAQIETANQNFIGLNKQADIVAKASEKLKAEMAKLREMSRSIASQHQKATGRLALDDRIPKEYVLPKIDKLTHSIIIHNEHRSFTK